MPMPDNLALDELAETAAGDLLAWMVSKLDSRAARSGVLRTGASCSLQSLDPLFEDPSHVVCDLRVALP